MSIFDHQKRVSCLSGQDLNIREGFLTTVSEFLASKSQETDVSVRIDNQIPAILFIDTLMDNQTLSLIPYSTLAFNIFFLIMNLFQLY